MLAHLDQLLEVSRQGHIAFGRLLRFFHRAREIEELPEEAPNVLGIGENQLHLQSQNLFELVGPGANERLAGRDSEDAVRDGDRQDAVALGVGIRHRLRHRDEVDLQRVDVLIRHTELACQPFDQGVQRQGSTGRRLRAPFLVGDQLQRVLEALSSRPR